MPYDAEALRRMTPSTARAYPAERGGRRCAPGGAPVRRTGQRWGDTASSRLPAPRGEDKVVERARRGLHEGVEECKGLRGHTPHLTRSNLRSEALAPD